MPTGDIQQIKSEKFIEIYDFLHTLILGEVWAGVQKIWKLLPPGIWAGYDLFGFEELQEQILLDAELAKLKETWRSRPKSFFGKHFDDPNAEDSEEGSEQSGLQSEESGTAEAGN